PPGDPPVVAAGRLLGGHQVFPTSPSQIDEPIAILPKLVEELTPRVPHTGGPDDVSVFAVQPVPLEHPPTQHPVPVEWVATGGKPPGRPPQREPRPRRRRKPGRAPAVWPPGGGGARR